MNDTPSEHQVHSTASKSSQPIHRVVLLAALVAGLYMVLMVGPVAADDWPQWLGPHRDSHWREEGIVEQLPSTGAKVRWRAPLHGGYTGPAVAKQRVYVMDYVTQGDRRPDPDKRSELLGKERVICLDARSGAELWKHEYDCPYKISYASGPRATPTVDGDRVYTVGAEGDLLCLDAAQGDLIWARSFKKDFQAVTPLWGFAGHPLIDGDRLICIAGGPNALVVALDKMTGKELWRALDSPEPGYSAPTMLEMNGHRQLLIWHGMALVSLNPESGETYWSEKLEPDYGMAIAVPRWSGDLLFVGGIRDKSMMMRLDEAKPAAQLAWLGKRDVGIDPYNATPFAENGYLYGVNREGQLCAVQMTSGEILWKTYELMPEKRRTNTGTIYLIKQGDRFLLVTDSGDLIAAQLKPTGYHELSRIHLVDPTSDSFGRSVAWSHPAFANRCVYVRNDQEIVCVSLDAADYPKLGQ